MGGAGRRRAGNGGGHAGPGRLRGGAVRAKPHAASAPTHPPTHDCARGCVRGSSRAWARVLTWVRPVCAHVGLRACAEVRARVRACAFTSASARWGARVCFHVGVDVRVSARACAHEGVPVPAVCLRGLARVSMPVPRARVLVTLCSDASRWCSRVARQLRASGGRAAPLQKRAPACA